MHKPSSHPYPESASKGTATSSRAFVETIEYSRFVEFCDACRHSATSGCAMDRPALVKLSPPCATAARIRSFRVIVGPAK
jgi:hypothetical protein